MTGTEIETLTRSPGGQLVDTEEEPSAEWGWSGQFPRLTRVMGWLVFVALLVAQIGNHEGNIENIWLSVFAALTALILILDIRRRRTSWRR